ncbi:hypothetical protein ACH5RR_037161 [Cinchona calisaya]|uniref:Uncharacterized protein n=1 Tax=Cinchona calisaya TaxID=153742 RepID=A0ABD2YA13_9GENT
MDAVPVPAFLMNRVSGIYAFTAHEVIKIIQTIQRSNFIIEGNSTAVVKLLLEENEYLSVIGNFLDNSRNILLTCSVTLRFNSSTANATNWPILLLSMQE